VTFVLQSMAASKFTGLCCNLSCVLPLKNDLDLPTHEIFAHPLVSDGYPKKFNSCIDQFGKTHFSFL